MKRLDDLRRELAREATEARPQRLGEDFFFFLSSMLRGASLPGASATAATFSKA
jgi:hypothetical protein